MKILDIEKLLQWAYRDELPKTTDAPRAAWDRVSEYGARGGLSIDQDFGDSPPCFPVGMGECHPDAKVIAAYVNLLPTKEIDWISRDAILGDLVALFPPDETPLIPVLQPRELIIMHASMGTRPDCLLKPKPYPSEPAKGAGVAIVGECYGKHRYKLGTHCPVTWEPRPCDVLFGRAEYAAWHHGLIELTASLTGVLREHQPLSPACPAEPWNEKLSVARILRSVLDNNPQPFRKAS